MHVTYHRYGGDSFNNAGAKCAWALDRPDWSWVKNWLRGWLESWPMESVLCEMQMLLRSDRGVGRPIILEALFVICTSVILLASINIVKKQGKQWVK